MKSSEIKIGELLFFCDERVFGVVYRKDEEGFYLIDWCDGKAQGEYYTEVEVLKWRMLNEY